MSSEVYTVLEQENAVGIIHSIMLKYQLRTDDIDEKRKYVVVHGRGEFECSICNYTWHSYFSWMRIDLKDQRIAYKWSMKCKHCLYVYKPAFPLAEMEKLSEKAVCQYKGIRYQNPNAEGGSKRAYFEYREPHLPSLCEKCGWGQTQCWWSKQHD